MGLFDRWFGKAGSGATIRDGMYVIRDAAIAAHIVRPTQPNFATEGAPPCAKCGAPMDEYFLTTGGPLGDPAVWDEHPIAVDAWVCVRCAAFAYPRRFEPKQMTAFGNEGVAAVRAGRFDEAEWRFTRIVWNWPGWAAGYVDLASAILDGLRVMKDLPPLDRHRRRERARKALEFAIEAFEKDREHNPEDVVSVAHIRLAELAIEDRMLDRARREIDAFFALAVQHPKLAEHANEMSTYIAERRDLFDAAATAIDPYLRLMGRAAKPVDSPESRATVVKALEQLEEHYAVAPHRWQAAWMIAMGRAALDDTERALAAWKAAWERHEGIPEIAREYSLALLRSDRATEALDVNRAITRRKPGDASLWCNRAVVELLCGEIDEATRCLDRSDAIDPNDTIAKAVRKRLADVAAGRRPAPRTLRELESG